MERLLATIRPNQNGHYEAIRTGLGRLLYGRLRGHVYTNTNVCRSLDTIWFSFIVYSHLNEFISNDYWLYC